MRRKKVGLIKRGNVFYFDYYLDGRRIRQSSGTIDEDIARLKAMELEVKLTKGELELERPDPPIEQVLTQYLRYCDVDAHLSDETQLRYGQVLDHLAEFLKVKYPHIKTLSQIKEQMIKDYIIWRREESKRKISKRTANFELQAIKTLFNWAVNDKATKYLKENPAKGVKEFRFKRDESPPRFLSEAECQKLLGHSGQYYATFLVFLYTGLRRDELRLLEWSGINFITKTLTPTHSKTGKRVIPINGKVITCLAEIKARQKTGQRWVFPDENGKPFLKNKLRRILIRVAKEAGIDDLSKLHTLRHSFASHLVMKGVEIRSIQKLMGHSSIKTTQIYAGVSPKHLAEQIDKLDF